jgi:hypothetical protein
MRMQWKRVVTVAAVALGMGIAAPAWSGLADPMMEDYTVHVLPFYKTDAGWNSFLVVADTSYRDLKHDGSAIDARFYDADCHFKSDAVLKPTKNDSQAFALDDINEANGQFNGIPGEGVILLDGNNRRFLTYMLLVNTNNNSLVRIDSIPCKWHPEDSNTPTSSKDGRVGCKRSSGSGDGTWLRYDSVNTVAATLGDKSPFLTNLYFFSAAEESDLVTELGLYGYPRGGGWAKSIHTDGYCDEIYLGSRRLDLTCTQRVRLTSFNYTNLNVFPDDDCRGKPGHIVTYSSDNGVDSDATSYSGFQETIGVFGGTLIGTGYMHHSDNYYPQN